MVKIKGLFGLGDIAGWLGRYTYRRAGVVANPYPIGILPNIKLTYSIPAFGLNPYPPFIANYYSVKGWIYQRRRTWHGIEYIAKRANTPREPGTPYQMGNWIAFREAVKAWQKLTKEQKDIYNKWTHPRHASGYNRFISWYLKVNKYMPIYWGTLRRSETDDRTIEDYTVVRHNPQITYPFQFYNKQAFNFVLHKGGGFPHNPVEGQLFYREDEKKVYKYDGVAWQEIGGGAASKVLPTTVECNEQNRGLLRLVEGAAGADDRVWICKRDYNLNYQWQLLDPPIPGFKYLRQLVVNYYSGWLTLTDYQIKFSLDTESLITQGKLKPDGSDIRILDTDNQTELPYWIEGPLNSNQTVIWVKKPLIPGGWFTFMYLYYGNKNAEPKSSISETFVREINGGQPLLAAWHFDELDGNVAIDTSGNGNNGTLVNGVVRTYEARYGRAVEFDGEDDFIGGIGNFGQPSTFTLSLWVKARDGGDEVIIGQSSSQPPGATSSFVPVIAIRSNGRLRAELWTGTGGGIETTFSLRDNQWHHVVLVAGNNTQYLYVDTNYIGARTGALIQNWWQYTQIGTGYCGTGRGFPFYGWHYFTGIIDEVLIFNRALTFAEITDLYNHYGYTTLNYPGRVLVRKRFSTEPNVSVNDEL